MSGAFGWNRHQGNDTGSKANATPSYTDAKRAHNFSGGDPVRRVTIDTDDDDKRDMRSFATSGAKLATPGATHRLKSTAANVMVVVVDMTGSMGEWPKEIFKRLPLLYTSAMKYLGVDDLEVLFVAHGDAYSDRDPIQVATFARGKDLDAHLASFVACGGGGQGHETHELVAYYLSKMVDTSSARNVFAFFITDESAYDRVSAQHIKEHLGVDEPSPTSAGALFAELARRMHVNVILRNTDSYEPAPIKAWWDRAVGSEHVLPLSDARRVVDVMLGTMASMLGQRDQFEDDLKTRLLTTKHGAQNVNTVMGSIAMVGKGTPTSPFQVPDDKNGQRRLPPPGGGTKSLLDD